MESNIRGFKDLIRKKQARIAVVGLGYVGLPLAVEFAKKNFPVLGLEVDKDRLEHIKNRVSYISDVPTRELKAVLRSGKFRASGEFSALKEADVIIICVPTPLKRKYLPDISYIKQAVYGISKNLKKGALVVLESTTYPGTTEEVIKPILESRGFRCGTDFYLAFSPERIDPGNEKYPVNKIPKVMGGITPGATELTAAVYGNIIEKVVPVTSARVAEVVKLLENTFRLINIAMIDELAMMAHKMKIDIWEVIDAAKTKPFGFMPFYPGPGVGGHCIPKDPLYLYWKAKHHGFKPRFIKLASDIITRMPEYVTERVADLINAASRSRPGRVLVVGVTYKKDIKDLRKSPALDMIDSFQKKGVKTAYHDPLIPYLKWNHIDLKSSKLNKRGLAKFDCVVIASEHSNIDYDFLLRNSKLIFDTRNVYKGKKNRKVVSL
ncbi:MAG: nucleotide sugar dehydrogenase [Candidatus Omnitrophica bacterium]|nr:nucleotide sugar dehydrogenase [Candidatus Omnitrophota bacterium]MDD5553654.1 nucleotide sugar dehydrogenase [Candidatus Omnitrophota bacterium]